MLIYNYQKEFLGIDTVDLEALGFKDLAELRAESADFADMFVKTPGYVHNFKHVHWIDFITCDEYSDNSKVIIHAKNKNYRCILEVETLYLVDAPAEKAYKIHLSNLRELTPAENEQISGDILERPIPISTTESVAIFTHSELEQEPTKATSYLDGPIDFDEIPQEENLETLDDTFTGEEKTFIQAPEILDDHTPSIPDTKIDIELEEQAPKPKPALQKTEEPDFKVDLNEPIEEIIDETPQENSHNEYRYDPEVASRELGLPADLIEEFIEDFINQANDFKPKIYEALENNDQDNVKILSHKLKGVAANLRIEHAFDVLATINTSNDYNEIKRNLAQFYTIISSLSTPSKKPKVIQNDNELAQIIEKDLSDDLVLSFKEDDEVKEPETTLTSTKKEEIDFDEDLFIENEDDDSIFEMKYDKKKVAREIGISDESFNELYKDYIFEAKILIEAMEEALKLNTPQKWSTAAVKLKKMSTHMRLYLFTDELDTLSTTEEADKAHEALHSLKEKFEHI